MKKYIIAGLIILFNSSFLHFFTNFLLKYQDTFRFLHNKAFVSVIAKILIILLLCVFIFVLGFVARWFFFNSLINMMNKIFSKIPFVKSIYKTLKDVISSFVSVDERKAFRYTTMVEFPSKDTYCVGFVSGDIPHECTEKAKEELTPVFLPTAPHPISGYFVMVPNKLIHKIDMSNEDAVKFTVYCGLILPGEKLPDVFKK